MASKPNPVLLSPGLTPKKRPGKMPFKPGRIRHNTEPTSGNYGASSKASHAWLEGGSFAPREALKKTPAPQRLRLLGMYWELFILLAPASNVVSVGLLPSPNQVSAGTQGPENVNQICPKV